MNLQQLQKEVSEWGIKNFPDSKPHHPLLGIQEEAGELAHAHLKGEQGIRHTPQEIFDMKKDAVADIIIYIAHYCAKSNIDLDGAVSETWFKVVQRDWQKNPLNADKV